MEIPTSPPLFRNWLIEIGRGQLPLEGGGLGFRTWGGGSTLLLFLVDNFGGSS